ncbi:MAG TPA: VOC family protein [Nitrososphaeraceae archaeon]|jgi:catechol 2,3-dioxygenase-like lactoylglutathione lyase family enzyme|nr:VOC family protein [Nitrososphaeraceae archaeon]
MFRRISAIILLVQDMKKSIDFYSNVLGMEKKQESEDWVEFLKQGTVIALHPVKKKVSTNEDQNNRRTKRSGNALIGFNVSDLESVCNELKTKQVKFHKNLKNESFGKHAIIEDPEGNLISLAEMAPKEEFMQIPYYHGFAPV